jgi:hypothetical protein
MSFSLAQRKELKETSTLTKPSPILEGCKVRIWENRKSLLPFWQAGTTAYLITSFLRRRFP